MKIDKVISVECYPKKKNNFKNFLSHELHSDSNVMIKKCLSVEKVLKYIVGAFLRIHD